MRHLRVLTLVFLIILLFDVSVLATDSASIGGKSIVCGDEYQLVPVCLSGNQGIMGYKITVEYPTGVEIKDIVRGTLCSTGNFDTNLKTHDENKIDIVWNNSENISGNGSLFVLNLKADKKAVDKEIKFSYSKDDTFNEEWKDVALVCKSICIVEKEVSEKNADLANDIITDKDYDYIRIVVESQIEKSDKNSLSDLSEKEKNTIVESVSSKLSGINIESFEDIVKLYNEVVKKSFVTETMLQADSQIIDEAVKKGLESTDQKKIDNIPEKNKEKFNQVVVDKLQESVAINESFKALDENEKFEGIKNIYNRNTEKNNDKKDMNIIMVLIIISIVIGVVVLVFLEKRRRAKIEKSFDVVNGNNDNYI